MKKFVLGTVICALMLSNAAFAQYDEYDTAGPYYDQGMQYLQNSQYTSAIQEFKKALRENPFDLSSKIGLTNAYISRAAYYNNKSFEYQKAINDLRSALFYMKYYDDAAADYNTAQAAEAAQKNLDMVMSSVGADKSPKGHLNAAKILRSQGEFAASAYEYFLIKDNPQFRKESSLALGDIMKIMGQPQKSAFYYEQVVQTDPKNADLQLKLARAYEEIDNAEGAAKAYNLALQNSSEKEDILISLEKIWQQKVTLNPQDAEAHANLGVVYQKQAKYDLAMAEYRKAEEINPANANTRLNLGTLYQFQKNYDGAIAAYNSIIQLYPNHVEAHTYKAQCLRALGQNQDAIKEYQLAMNYEPNNTAVRTELFELLKATMPADQVLSYLYQNVQNQPLDPNTYYDFAYELHKANKLDDAIVYYKETIKLNPASIDSYVNLSQVYRQKNNFNEAMKVIEDAKKLYPENAEVKKQYNSLVAEVSASVYTTAASLFEQGKYQEAIASYSKIQPATSESLIGIAACYQALESYKLAIDNYKKALALDPTNPDIPYYIGSVYLNLDDYANARVFLNKAITLDKTNEKAKSLLKFAVEQENNALLEKALNYYDQNNYLEALKIVNSVLLKDSRCGAAYYYRGMIYDAQKKYTLAVVDYQTAVKYSSDFSLAYYSLGVDYDILGRRSEAKIAYQKYLASKPEENDFTKYARKRVAEIK